MGTLYFDDSRGNHRVVKENIAESEVNKAIHEFVKELNPNYKIYYCRMWKREDGDTVYDVGSWSELFVYKPIKEQ